METIENKNEADKANNEGEKWKQSNEPLLTEKYKKKCDCPHFLLKLYEILENKDYKDIIHWSEDGKYFIVQNLHDFTEKILPKYYKHNNFSSFIRQLNMYDFHKKKSSQNEHIFHHNNFIRDRKDLIKTIKRKSKKENIPMNTYAPNNKIFNTKQTNLVPVSNLNLFNNINYGLNNSINNRKSSLSIDDDFNLNNSVHSLFESNPRPLLPMGLPSSPCENTSKNNNIKSNSNSNNVNSYNYNNLSNALNSNGIGNVNINFNALNDDKKVTKKNLQHLLAYLMNSIEENTEKEKQLELKIERLSKQNEEFITQNQKILQEIISKSDYNKKLEAVICFILEMFMSKPKIKSNSEPKNLFLSNESSNKLPNINKFNKLDNLGIVNFSSNHDANGILSQNDFLPTSDAGLEPFQNFLNKYLDKKKNTGLLTNIESNYNNNKNLLSDIEGNKYPKICSGNEDAIQNVNTQNNAPTSTDLICKKRKRSASFNSILSNLSGGTNVIYDNSYKNKGDENIKEVEEKKTDNENINVDNSLNNDLLNNSWSKSKNAFDIDLNQEESKSEFSDWNKDLLNNSQSSINDIYNSSNINKDNEFFDINN